MVSKLVSNPISIGMVPVNSLSPLEVEKEQTKQDGVRCILSLVLVQARDIQNRNVCRNPKYKLHQPFTYIDPSTLNLSVIESLSELFLSFY